MLGFGSLTLATIITRALVLLIAFPVHEGAHALVADRLGDPTPRRAGRMTLNPVKHLDLVGSLLFLVFGFGWAYTPIDPYRLGRRGAAIVSLAGPIANLLIAIAFAPVARVVLASPELRNLFRYEQLFPSLGQIMYAMVFLNLLLFVFNLIPVPPLDGFRILLGILPYPLAQSFQKIERFGSLIILVVILIVPSLFAAIINPPLTFLLQLLLGL
jgi:Zn-dependent protease